VALYRLTREPVLVAPAIVVAFDGWVDAGTAATTAAQRVAEGGQVIATFDADAFFDYRARRPTLEIVDGRPSELSWPELSVRHARIGARDLLVLAGPEPDYRWQALCDAVLDLVRRLGVTEWISLGAIPAAVPHTRPVPVMGTASRAELLRGGVEPGPAGILRVPAAALSVLEIAIEAAGIPAVGYYAQVPHYVAGPSPAAAIELLRVLGRHLEIEIPLGPLPDEARELRARLDLATAADEATRAHVERLEARVDQERRPTGDALIAEIEQFLRERGNEGRGPA
jgi:proteasome assembly chaperone (PAC2) family protein